MVNDPNHNPVATSDNQPASFETSLAELETIVHQLEDGQLGLAEALERYEQGVKHLKHCYTLLQDAERKIELLTGVKDDGTPVTEPFDDQATALAESAGRKRSRKGKTPPPLAVADDEGDSADIDG